MKKKQVHQGKLEKEYDIAYDFAIKAYKQFRDVIKAIVLFGSVPKKEVNVNSDIDIVLLIDDATVNWDDELIGWYRQELTKLVAGQKYSRELHINTVTLSSFWEELRLGEPLVINVVRYGQVLVDVGGFFNPLKILLAKGHIRPSAEAVFMSMQRSLAHQVNGRRSMLSAVDSFYWAMVDAAHAALMAKKVTPPSPEHIAELVEHVFVKPGMISGKYVDWFEKTRRLSKDIVYGKVTKVNGDELVELEERTEKFVEYFNELTKSLIKDEKIIRAEVKK